MNSSIKKCLKSQIVENHFPLFIELYMPIYNTFTVYLRDNI